MHDIDRTQLEYTHEAGPFQHEEFEFQEFESGMMHEELSEQEEIQLAHELLAVNNEQELEQFLGSFLKRAVSTVGQIAKSPLGKAIGGVLKSVAKKALPMAGTALGGWVGGPLGAKIGRASCRERGVDLGGRRIIKKKKKHRRKAVLSGPSPNNSRQGVEWVALDH